MPRQPFAIDHLVIVASSVPATLSFYEAILGAEVRDFQAWQRGEVEYPVLHLGAWKINVHPVVTEATPRSANPVPGGLDIALRWDGSIAEAVEWLEERGVVPELGPVAQVGALGDADSVYFRDPDGALLELICYPNAPR